MSSSNPPEPSSLWPPPWRSVGQLRTWLVRVSLYFAPKERHRVYVLTIVLGVVCGLAAVSFHGAIRGAEALLIDRAFTAPGRTFMWWIVLTPALGGLAVGFILYRFTPAARGSGIPLVKYNFMVRGGRIRLRDSAAKFALATLQIGSGSSLGREGPTVHICAGIATAFGRWLALSPQNQARLAPVGAAAGIAAAFNAPIAAVTFVIEEIVGDLNSRLLSGIVIAAAIAAVVERSVLGEHPVLAIPYPYELEHASSLLTYLLLGGVAGIAACLFYAGLLRLRALVSRSSSRFAWAWPACGGLVTGLIAMALFASFRLRGVTGDGYTTLSAALRGELPLVFLLLLAAAKLVSTVASYSTGGCGGLFAPVLFIGAMLGGALGHVDGVLFGHANAELGSFALVGMGAFFAAVIRAPITSVLIIFEMTGGYGLVLPLMLANTVAYTIAKRAFPVPIYEQLLQQDGLFLPDQQRVAEALSSLHVQDAMTAELVTLPAADSVEQAHARAGGYPYASFPVVGVHGEVRGLVSQSKLERRVAEGWGATEVGELAQVGEYLRPEERLVAALVRMNHLGVRQMLVVTDGDRAAGMLAMSDVMRAYANAAGSVPPAHAAS